ncbi:MAG: ribose 5-phosphate isomerase B [Clostridia bacterium]|nr:ribose 5-phosphate isomerase B [Clostridia bacterium]
MIKNVAIACDHGGYELKLDVIRHLEEKGIAYEDFGCNSTESVDYPDYGIPAAKAVAEGKFDAAILICGTGIGMSLCANKVKGIRAAVCSDTFCARMTRAHNNANVLCMGARVIGLGVALDIVDAFLGTEFEGGRHATRVEKVMAEEKADR